MKEKIVRRVLMMKIHILLLIILNILGLASALNVEELDQYLDHYELTTVTLADGRKGSGGVGAAPGPIDILKVSFDLLGKRYEVVVHRSPDSMSNTTEVEIHDSGEVRTEHYKGKFYELENGTASVLGYVTGMNTFEGIIELGNATYYLAQVWTVSDGVKSLKTIVYNVNDVKAKASPICSTCNDQEIPEAEGRKTSTPYSRIDYISLVTPSIRARFPPAKKQTSGSHEYYSLRFEMIGDYELYKKYNDTAIDFMYLLVRSVDRVFRKMDFGKMSVRIIPQKITIYHTEDDFGRYEPSIESYLDSAIKSHKANGHGDESSTTFFLTGHKFTDFKGISQQTGLCSSEKYGAMTIDGNMLSIMTFIHEAGHVLGAKHDDASNPKCANKYIMSPIVSAGPNRNRFSPCSIEEISKTLMDAKTRKCIIPMNPTCGDAFKEEGEDCDCGNNSDMCDIADKCCTPKGGKDGDHECSYRKSKGYACSDNEDPCCENCKIAPKGTRCSLDEECVVGTCDGVSKDCLIKRSVPDHTPCKGGYHTCHKGSCNSTLCLDKGYEDCICRGDDACTVCCSLSGRCKTAQDWSLVPASDMPPYLPLGTACHGRNYSGRCGSDGTCEEVSSILGCPYWDWTHGGKERAHERNRKLAIGFGAAAGVIGLAGLGYLAARHANIIPKGNSSKSSDKPIMHTGGGRHHR